MTINVNRSFGDLNSIDPTLLSYMSKGFSLINGCTRVLWGILFDKISFKTLYTIICFMEIIANFSIYYVVSNQELYFVLNMIVALAFAGNTSLLPPLVSRKFGLK
jgi:nitrate/nitrite transporter NarK